MIFITISDLYKINLVKIFIYNFNVAIAYWLENVTVSSSVLVVYITYQNI